MPTGSKDRSPSIGDVGLFAGVSPEALRAIERRCKFRTLGPRESVLGYLEPTTDVYFILSGQARVSIYSADGKAVTFTELNSGDAFGEYAALDGGPRSASIETRTKCLVASMSATAFSEVVRAEPTVAMTVIRQLIGKVRVLSKRIYEFSSLAVNNRIQAELLRIAASVGPNGNAAELDPAPNHADLASRTSTHREAVSREISRLARLGIVEKRGNRLIIKDLHRLGGLVREATGE